MPLLHDLKQPIWRTLMLTLLFFEQEQERVRWEEQRKAMQQDSQSKAQLAQYNDELARKRVDFEHEKGRQRNAEIVALQEDSTRRQEAEKQRAAAEIEAERRATEERRVSLLGHAPVAGASVTYTCGCAK